MPRVWCGEERAAQTLLEEKADLHLSTSLHCYYMMGRQVVALGFKSNTGRSVMFIRENDSSP